MKIIFATLLASVFATPIRAESLSMDCMEVLDKGKEIKQRCLNESDPDKLKVCKKDVENLNRELSRFSREECPPELMD